jgi:hypothetical protein
MEITLKGSDVRTIRRLNAVINGKVGGATKSTKRAAASRRNIRKAIKARIAQAA